MPWEDLAWLSIQNTNYEHNYKTKFEHIGGFDIMKLFLNFLDMITVLDFQQKALVIERYMLNCLQMK